MSDPPAPTPRVAVIIPCRGYADLVQEALASIREPEPVEVVVVDDGTPDRRAQEQIEQLAGPGIKVVRREHGGPAAARTTGLEATAAPLVFPLDADDLLEAGVLSDLGDLLAAHPEAGFAWGDYVTFGDHSGHYRAPRRVLPWSLTYMNPYPGPSLLRRDALVHAGGWQGSGYEDWNLWLAFVELGIEGVAADRVVFRRRLHGAQGRLAADRPRHQQLYEELRARHRSLFERRHALARIERPPPWKRVAYPVLLGPRRVVPRRVELFIRRTVLRRGIRLHG